MRRWWALAVLATAQSVLVLDDTIVNVALASIQDDLGGSTAGLAWVVNGYILAFAGRLLLGGRLADLLGRRRVFVVGMALFGVASLLCGLARSEAMPIAARVLQGTGSALVAPAALALVLGVFPDPVERARAVGLSGGLAALGGTPGRPGAPGRGCGRVHDRRSNHARTDGGGSRPRRLRQVSGGPPGSDARQGQEICAWSWSSSST